MLLNEVVHFCHIDLTLEALKSPVLLETQKIQERILRKKTLFFSRVGIAILSVFQSDSLRKLKSPV
jgi:hypothetical protein